MPTNCGVPGCLNSPKRKTKERQLATCPLFRPLGSEERSYMLKNRRAKKSPAKRSLECITDNNLAYVML